MGLPLPSDGLLPLLTLLAFCVWCPQGMSLVLHHHICNRISPIVPTTLYINYSQIQILLFLHSSQQLLTPIPNPRPPCFTEHCPGPSHTCPSLPANLNQEEQNRPGRLSWFSGWSSERHFHLGVPLKAGTSVLGKMDGTNGQQMREEGTLQVIHLLVAQMFIE